MFDWDFEMTNFVFFYCQFMTHFLIDERRMKVVEMGGALDLLNMLKTAKDDKTRKQALKTLVALSHSGKSKLNDVISVFCVCCMIPLRSI